MLKSLAHMLIVMPRQVIMLHAARAQQPNVNMANSVPKIGAITGKLGNKKKERIDHVRGLIVWNAVSAKSHLPYL